MAISVAVRRYYAERITGQSTRREPPPNFRPLEASASGRATVEGCRGGGKNILTVSLLAGEGERIADVRLSCGLCNPAMFACADVVAEWARGKAFDEVLALDPLDANQLDPFWERLGGPGRPDDAREKFQYALLALQRAVLDARGLGLPPLPAVAAPQDAD